MPTYSVTIPEEGMSLSEIFSPIPDRVRIFLKQGFRALGELSEDKREELFRTLVRLGLQPHHQAGAVKLIASDFGLSRETAPALLGASNMIMAMLSARDDSASDVATALTEAGLVEKASAEAVLAFCKLVIGSRTELKEAMDRSTLSAELLPSLVTFSSIVDIRPRFEGEAVSLAEPVVLASISTDAPNNRLWFQMSRSQLKGLIEDLNATLHRVNIAAEWIQTKR